jgi:hypothetical protein
MESNQTTQTRTTANRVDSLQMNTYERARAREGMAQAMLLADLTLAGTTHVRNALDSAGHAMYLAFGRGRA